MLAVRRRWDFAVVTNFTHTSCASSRTQMRQGQLEHLKSFLQLPPRTLFPCPSCLTITSIVLRYLKPPVGGCVHGYLYRSDVVRHCEVVL